MADPQPEDAHLRVAHSINEAIMLRDFSKRQRKILDLILRLSWGCGKKTAIITRQKDFAVVGVGEGHIKAEVIWLLQSKIIFIEGNEYRFNKNFDDWQISRVHPFEPEKLTEMVRLNLIKTYQNGKIIGTELTETVSSNLPKQEESTYRNGKFLEPELASPKEILKKYINKEEPDNNINNNYENREMAEKIWSDVLVKIKGHVSKPNYNTWFSRTVGLSCEDGVFKVLAPATVIDHIMGNMCSMVEMYIIEVAGERMKVRLYPLQVTGPEEPP